MHSSLAAKKLFGVYVITFSALLATLSAVVSGLLLLLPMMLGLLIGTTDVREDQLTTKFYGNDQ
jgi:hypothetical protein